MSRSALCAGLDLGAAHSRRPSTCTEIRRTPLLCINEGAGPSCARAPSTRAAARAPAHARCPHPARCQLQPHTLRAAVKTRSPQRRRQEGPRYSELPRGHTMKINMTLALSEDRGCENMAHGRRSAGASGNIPTADL